MTTPVNVLDPIVALMEESRTFDGLKVDYEQPMTSLRFDSDQLVVADEYAGLFGSNVSTATPAMSLNDGAFDQWRMLFGPDLLGAGSDKTLNKRDWDAIRSIWPNRFGEMANDLLNRRVDRLGDKNLLVRTHDNAVRGLLSDRYAIVDNTQLLETIHELMEADAARLPQMRVHASNVTADDLYLRFTVKTDENRPGGSGGNYGVGMYVGNSEVGRRSIIVRPLIQRTSCSNSITFADSNIQTRFRHTGNPAAVLAQVKVAAAEALRFSVEALDKVYEATARELPGLFSIINDLAEEHGWSETMTDAVKMGTEGANTHMGLVNGVTYAAHKATDNPDTREEMELIGGQLLFANVRTLETRARRYDARMEARARV